MTDTLCANSSLAKTENSQKMKQTVTFYCQKKTYPSFIFYLFLFKYFRFYYIKKNCYIAVVSKTNKQTSTFHLFSISIHQMILAPLGPNRSSSVHQSVIGLSRDKTRCTTAGLKHNTCKHYRYSTIVLLFFIQV